MVLVDATNDPVVTIREGRVRGILEQLCNGSHCYSFKGIPYAQPPVGELRFRAPLPPKSWAGVYDATKHGPICPQIDMTKAETDVEDEDCLYLNVYTKNLDSNARLPVMVYIHGGAFMSGSGNSHAYGPDYLLQHDVILVTFNYRVEVFGFLCLDTPEVPGNAGMKDQVAVLRWVKSNIKKFGGNPNNITLFGNSAGGACVTYHMVSNMSQGLFHRAIIQSGVFLMDWTQGTNGKERALRLAKLLGKSTTNVVEVCKFLQSLPVNAFTSKVTKKTLSEDEIHRGIAIHFCPVVEKKFDGIEQFLTENPIEKVIRKEANKVPIIAGYNLKEGIFFLSHRLKNMDFMNKNPGFIVQREISEKLSKTVEKKFGEDIKNFYFGDKNCTEEDIDKICDRETDIHMVYPIHRFIHFYSKISKSIYLYKFNCDSGLNFIKQLMGYSHLKGACHADEVFYLFRDQKVKKSYDEEQAVRDMVYRITKLWTNFAKTGNPTPDNSLRIKWRPYADATKEYLNIDETLSIGKNPDRDRMEFWDSLYSRAGLPCMHVRSFKFYGTTAGDNMDPIISVKEGKLKGAVDKLFDGTEYYSFKGIPYAEPPVGKLRFKAPLPPKPWQGVYEAIEHGSVCPQYDITTMQILEGNEDCLYLNVYTKSLQSRCKTPVMVFIHGGGFMSGSGNAEMYGPKFLLQHDVVLVTINYRLELLGFLCLDTPEVPGNAGMKDQVAALRWVKSNIAQFGGDPNNITIFGESAGGVSVTYHLVSPLSKGLFHKTICQSGVSICEWAQGKELREKAFTVGKYLGKETSDTNELLEFLQSVPIAKLTNKITYRIMSKDEKRGLALTFCPVIEKKFDATESFITEAPIDSIMSNKIAKVPSVIGYNAVEAMVLGLELIKKYDVINKYPSFTIPKEIARKVNKAKLEEMGQRVKTFYTGDRDFTEKDLMAMCDILSDINFVYNIHRFANLYAKHNESVYMYRFNYDTDLNFIKKLSGCSGLKGAGHADEMFYMFSSVMTEDLYKEQEKLKNIVYKVTKLWTDFAKTGDPTPDIRIGDRWDPYTVGNREFLNIDDTMSMGKYADRERVEFWNKLYNEAGLPCLTKSNL